MSACHYRKNYEELVLLENLPAGDWLQM